MRNLFKDERLIKSHVGAFCILDGDHSKDITNCIITIPGQNGFQASQGLAPEQMLFNYAKHLYDTDDDFWDNPEVMRQGFSKMKYQRSVMMAIERYDEESSNGTTSEKPRVFNKKLFNKHKLLFEYIFKRWLHDAENERIVNQFYKDLKIMFNKCALIRGINQREWQ